MRTRYRSKGRNSSKLYTRRVANLPKLVGADRPLWEVMDPAERTRLLERAKEYKLRSFTAKLQEAVIRGSQKSVDKIRSQIATLESPDYDAAIAAVSLRADF
jgi:hypothetical protein